MESDDGGVFAIIGETISAIATIMSPEAALPEPTGPVVMDLTIGEIARPFAASDLSEVILESGLSGTALFVILPERDETWLFETSAENIGAPLLVSVCGEEVLTSEVRGRMDQGSIRLATRLEPAAAERLAAHLQGEVPCPT